MKVMHIGKYSPPSRGGIESFTFALAKQQTLDGHHVCLLCHRNNSLVTKRRQIDGLRITEVGTFCKTAFSPISPMFGAKLRQEIRENMPDVIHVHLPNPAVVFTPLIPRDIPLVVHWHADVHGSPSTVLKLAYPAYKTFEQHLLSKAKCIIATSPPYLRASRSLRKWRDKCHVVPLGIVPGKADTEPQPPSQPTILSVGRFTYYKGFEHLVRAAELVPMASFVIAGNGPLHQETITLVNKMGLQDRITLPGEVTDRQLAALFAKSALFCLPSLDRGEAFGMVLLEAMNYGKPLISTSIPGSGTSWVNKNGVTGIVVPPKDPHNLAKAINFLLKKPELLQKYGRAARQRLLSNFTISNTSESIDKIYKKTIAATI